MCRHKRSGKAYVTDPHTRREVYLGAWGTPEAEANYRRWLAEFAARGDAPPPPPAAGLTVGQLVVAYLAWVDAEYTKDGKPTSEPESTRVALAPVVDLYALTPAAEFGPAALRAVRERYVGKGWRRTYVNRQVLRVRAMFKWAVSEELLPVERWQALRTVRGLKAGRTKAPEGRKVAAVPAAVVDATIAQLSERWQNVARLHWWGAMRAQDACGIRPADVTQDEHSTLWVYRPSRFKTQHLEGATRTLYLGRRCQELLRPLLAAAASPEAYLFARGDGQPVTVKLYRANLERACRRAGVPRWSPLQLRHTALTEARARFGLEGAQVRGGHKHARTSEIYAEKSEALARRIAEELG